MDSLKDLKTNKCNTSDAYKIDDQACDPYSATFYVYSSPPQPVWGRPKYRNNVPKPRGIHDYYNVMWDPRVRRGNPLRKAATAKQELERCLKSRTKKKVRKEYRPATPPPVDGRDHCMVQTDNIWEPLEMVSTSCDAKTLTIPYEELPINPWFTPSKVGEDKSTQIACGDLFDFNCEVQPLVETLVGKVVEQALLECMEEEELLTLKDQQMRFEERRREEQLRLERLKEREQRVHDEKERLMEEMELRHLDEECAQQRSGASVFSSLYLADMKEGAMRSLRSEGFINMMRIISTEFIPWLNCKVEGELACIEVARTVLDDIIQTVVNNREVEFAIGEQRAESHPPPTTPVEYDYGYGGEGE